MNNERIYIMDADNQLIGNEIQRLCVLADIQIPTMPKLVAEFIKEHFGLLPLDIIPKAFDNWISGKTAIKKPMTMNAHFLSVIMREYYDHNKHIIILKPRKMLEAPKNEPTKEELQSQSIKTYELCYNEYLDAQNGGTKLIPYLLEIVANWRLREQEYVITESDIEHAQTWITQYQHRRDNAMREALKDAGRIRIYNALPNPTRNIELVAITITHFERRKKGQEKSWI
jgi:hypothetical protein